MESLRHKKELEKQFARAQCQSEAVLPEVFLQSPRLQPMLAILSQTVRRKARLFPLTSLGHLQVPPNHP